MKKAFYLFIGTLVAFTVWIITMFLGSISGEGPMYRTDYVLIPISILSGIIVMCTLAIVDAIKEKQEKNNTTTLK